MVTAFHTLLAGLATGIAAVTLVLSRLRRRLRITIDSETGVFFFDISPAGLAERDRLLRPFLELTRASSPYAVMFQRRFATQFVDRLVLLFRHADNAEASLAFNLGSVSRNELLLHSLNAAVALTLPSIRAQVSFALLPTPGLKLRLDLDRTLSVLELVILRLRMGRV